MNNNTVPVLHKLHQGELIDLIDDDDENNNNNNNNNTTTLHSQNNNEDLGGEFAKRKSMRPTHALPSTGFDILLVGNQACNTACHALAGAILRCDDGDDT